MQRFKMRATFFSLLLLSLNAFSQVGVAVNTNGNAPAASAILDVQSTEKGFLLPRMSQAQRVAISNPALGLLVFDTDQQKLCQYQDGGWRFLIDNSYWASSDTRNRVYNTTDSIGIGTAAPTEKLQISNGNLRVLNGNIQLDGGDMYMNNTSGIIQLQAAGENKAYIQLSGNDLRLGTNAANTDGSFIVRTQGANQLTINDGGIDLTGNGKITRINTDTFNLLPACYGQVRANGTIIHSTPNVTIQHNPGSDQYWIKFDGVRAGAIAMVTPMTADISVHTQTVPELGGIWLQFRNVEVTFGQETGFNFLVFNP